MILRTRLSKDLKDAMLARDKNKLKTLRLIQTEIKRADIHSRTEGNGAEIDESAIMALMHKMIKQRHDAISIYTENGRSDAAESEAHEISVINAYLPALLTEEETKSAIETIIARLGASTRSDMGKVVGALKAEHPGEVDMKLGSKLIKDALP